LKKRNNSIYPWSSRIESLNTDYLIPERSIDNLFKALSKNEVINKNLEDEITKHIGIIKKGLES
jgi:hypothetical protein